MARIRTIKPDFWTDEKVVELSFPARLLFIGLWNFVDDEGRIQFSPKKLKMLIFPADSVEISELLGEIRRESLITVYEVDGVQYLQVNNFGKHQKVDKRSPSKLPAIDGTFSNPAESPRVPPTEGKGMEGEKDITTTPQAREDSDQNDSDAPRPNVIPDIPTLQSHWVIFFQRRGYDLWEIKKKPEVLDAFNDWIAKNVSTELVTLAVLEVEKKKGRVDISYYLPKIADRIRERDSPREQQQATTGRGNNRPQKFNGFDHINQNRIQPNGQHAGNIFDGEYRPVEPGQ